ncbi:Peroxidase [Aphelenchoides bicaudatus]|nr:Peroxidase [Aphelenchoides bicaudatus]
MSRNQRRRDSLRTEADDLFYDEYLRLRNGQRNGLQSRRNDRLPPLPRTSDSLISLQNRRQQTAASMRTLRTQDSIRSTSTVASAKAPNFKREGYEQLNSRLGDDPLTAVRLMRAQMTQMSLRDRLNERDVKSQFAREASRKLQKAEVDLESLQRKRTDALIHGDTLEARRLTREMQDIRSKATYDAYADLLLSEQQLASYGIRSKYAQNDRRRSRNRGYSPRGRNNYSSEERRRRDGKFVQLLNIFACILVDTPRDRSRRHSTYERGPYNRYIYTPPNAERSASRGRDRRRLFTGDSMRSQTAPPNNRRRSRRRDKTGVKKNKRLADIPPPPRPPTPPVQPKTPPTDVPPTPERGEQGVCPQCYERNPTFMSEEGLENTLGTVLSLSNEMHFVGGALKPCPLCGLAQYQGNSNHPNCNLKPPPIGAAYCPLCSKPVKPFSSKAAWRKHLIDDCYNNSKNMKRWSGRYAPANGSSLLGSLNGIQTVLPAGLEPTNNANAQPAQVVNNGGVNRSVPNAPAQQFQSNAGGGNPQPIQQLAGPVNPNNLRNAYNKLREERREDYIKQQQLDSALQQEKEDEEV